MKISLPNFYDDKSAFFLVHEGPTLYSKSIANFRTGKDDLSDLFCGDAAGQLGRNVGLCYGILHCLLLRVFLHSSHQVSLNRFIEKQNVENNCLLLFQAT